MIPNGSEGTAMAQASTDTVLDRDALRECVRTTLTRLSRTGELPTLSATATAALGTCMLTGARPQA